MSGAGSKKVGIYAGSFDPIHLGHLAFARQAMLECELDKVFFLVEPRPRRKQGVRALEHRLAMVRLAIRPEPKMGTILLDQTQFTVAETLPLLQQRFKGARLHLLMGDDVLFHLSEWPDVETLTRSVDFIVGVRESQRPEVEEHVRAIKRIRGISFHYNIIHTNLSSFSSSGIRAQLRAGRQPAGLPDGVAGYIQERGLYTASGDGAS